MSSAPSDRVSNNGLTVAAYAGDGDVLLAFSLDDNLLKQNDLAGFAIQCTPPTGQPYYLPNRLNYSQPVTAGTAPQQQTLDHVAGRSLPEVSLGAFSSRCHAGGFQVQGDGPLLPGHCAG